MNINQLKLKNFRNYDLFEETFSPLLNIFIGDNAQGKTNLMEAIYIIGTTKSFRRIEQDSLIKLNSEGALLTSSITKNGLTRDIAFKFIENRRKEILVNDKRINKSSEYIGNINVTMFSPDDLQLIKGDASNRRNFMDTLLCQTDKVYLNNLINYQRVLKQRNSILKAIKNNEASLDSLEPWNKQLCQYGSFIIMCRSRLCESVNHLAFKVQKIIKNNEELSLKYNDSIFHGQECFNTNEKVNDLFTEKLLEFQKEELARGTTLIGPHRDDINIYINLLNTRYFGSQGQQRSAAISMKMAEVEYIYQTLEEYPILLLDDIFSELDDKRKYFLLNYLKQNIQIFLTGTRAIDFRPMLDQALIFNIENGRASKQKQDITNNS